MSGTRPPFLDIIYAGTYVVIPTDRQEVVTELVTIEAGAVLHVLGKLVVIP